MILILIILDLFKMLGTGKTNIYQIGALMAVYCVL